METCNLITISGLPPYESLLSSFIRNRRGYGEKSNEIAFLRNLLNLVTRNQNCAFRDRGNAPAHRAEVWSSHKSKSLWQYFDACMKIL